MYMTVGNVTLERLIGNVPLVGLIYSRRVRKIFAHFGHRR
jgi:hypothetical protein